jgi:hypothetical protein
MQMRFIDSVNDDSVSRSLLSSYGNALLADGWRGTHWDYIEQHKQFHTILANQRNHQLNLMLQQYERQNDMTLSLIDVSKLRGEWNRKLLDEAQKLPCAVCQKVCTCGTCECCDPKHPRVVSLIVAEGVPSVFVEGMEDGSLRVSQVSFKNSLF